MGKSQLIFSANLLSPQRNSQPNKSHKIQGILIFMHHLCISILSTFISAHPTFVNQNSYSTIPRIANFGNSFYTTSSFFSPLNCLFSCVLQSVCSLSSALNQPDLCLAPAPTRLSHKTYQFDLVITNLAGRF